MRGMPVEQCGVGCPAPLLQMYSVGRGDDTSEWDVDSISFRANNEVDTAAWFEVGGPCTALTIEAGRLGSQAGTCMALLCVGHA